MLSLTDFHNLTGPIAQKAAYSRSGHFTKTVAIETHQQPDTDCQLNVSRPLGWITVRREIISMHFGYEMTNN